MESSKLAINAACQRRSSCADDFMSYNNILYFLAVILTLSAAPLPEQPWLPLRLALPLFAVLLLLFALLAAQQFRAASRKGGGNAYFTAESRLTLLATALFVGAVFLCDLRWHLQPLSVGGNLPTLAQGGGLMLFFLFLLLLWRAAQPSYRKIFGCKRSPMGFAAASLRSNLPLVLPWFFLSLTFDLFYLLPWPAARQMLSASVWSEAVSTLIALAFLSLLFPPLISRLWGCVPLPPGPQRDIVERFCRSQNFSAHIMQWPLLEGRALTAAVMGITPRCRYILLTPALLEALDQQELEAVLAHEIGHVKKRHLILYLLLLSAFGLLAQALAGPLLGLLLGSDSFWRLLLQSGLSMERLLECLSGAATLVFLLLYFRFLFGWFIRNFERQADLHAVQVQGGGWPLFRAFDKIAVLSGIRLEQKNWHHFGLGERMEFIVRCGQDANLISRHERRLRLALAAYFLLVVLVLLMLPPVDADALNRLARVQQVSALTEEKLRQEPGNIRLLQLRADLLLEQGKEQEAVAAYEQTIVTGPARADTLNNLAWLLLTAKDERLRDPARALDLASQAVRIEERGHILDTLAVALWTTGRNGEAARVADRAAEIDPANQAYYRSQAEKFTATPQL